MLYLYRVYYWETTVTLPSDVGLYNRLTVIQEFHVLEKASKAKEANSQGGTIPQGGVEEGNGKPPRKNFFQETT